MFQAVPPAVLAANIFQSVSIALCHIISSLYFLKNGSKVQKNRQLYRSDALDVENSVNEVGSSLTQVETETAGSNGPKSSRVATNPTFANKFPFFLYR